MGSEDILRLRHRLEGELDAVRHQAELSGQKLMASLEDCAGRVERAKGVVDRDGDEDPDGDEAPAEHAAPWAAELVERIRLARGEVTEP